MSNINHDITRYYRIYIQDDQGVTQTAQIDAITGIPADSGNAQTLIDENGNEIFAPFYVFAITDPENYFEVNRQYTISADYLNEAGGVYSSCNSNCTNFGDGRIQDVYYDTNDSPTFSGRSNSIRRTLTN